MFNNSISQENIEKYNSFQNRLKKENGEVKRLINSKEIRIGQYLSDVFSVLKGKKKIGQLVKRIDTSVRWKKVCKQFPINHEGVEKKRESNYFSDEKIIVYTAIFGKYDVPREPVYVPDNCDFVLFTDQDMPDDTAWKTMQADLIIPNYETLTNAERNRYCKMFPHKVLKGARYTIYIDGNIKAITDLTEFIHVDFKYGIQFHKHKARNCVYEEMKACKILKKSSNEAIDKYYHYLIGKNFPKKYGMVECNMIVRDSCNSIMKELMEDWWVEFHNHEVKRDQLSIPYLLWKYNIAIEDVSKLGCNIEDNDAIRITSHI